MPKLSAGVLMYRRREGESAAESTAGLEFFLVHPGGPFWARKDDGAWSIPKGEYAEDDDPLTAARREFTEETGCEPPAGPFLQLTTRKQPSGKRVSVWATEGDCDADAIVSNTFTMEWPPRSGKQVEFPEVDRAGWFDADEAHRKILKGQVGFIDELCELLGKPEAP